jgi:hypothetical protein
MLDWPFLRAALDPWRAPASRQNKLRVFAFFSALGLAASAFRKAPIAHDPLALAQAMESREGLLVDPTEMFWEPRTGFVDELIWGRPLLLLGRKEKSAPRDVYRVFVRLSNEGKPLALNAVYNLTNTELGDDHGLIVQDRRAAFATFAFGQEQSATLLDLGGDGAFRPAELSDVASAASQASVSEHKVPLTTRMMRSITQWQQTGRVAGVSRMDITFDEPAQHVGVDFKTDKPGSPARFKIRSAGKKERVLLSDDVDGEGSGAHATVAVPPEKILVHWAVDTVRAVSWIGPRPIAWLEEKVFAARDAKNKFLFRGGSKGSELAVKVEDTPASLMAPADLDGETFPPAALKSPWKTPEAGEGEWLAPQSTFVKRLPALAGAPTKEAAPLPFARTFVRPDEERPYSKVLLVAMDMRQMDLDMEAGIEDPKPLTGPPGSGKIPRDPKVYRRVAAAFNGGFKTEHGNYGMMVKRRVLLPPVAGAASVIITKDGRIGMGSWGSTTKVSGLKDVADDEIFSMRQNLESLLDNGVVNPTGRSLWGFTLPGTTMQTERSGICVTPAGHLIYAWGDDVNAITLGKAMKIAGCSYGMHLDMNPHHTGLVFTNVTELKGKNYRSELLTKQMEISPDRFLEYSPKDFFYLMMKEPGPPSAEGLSWTVDDGSQPTPAWLPGIYRAQSQGISLRSFEPDRFGLHVRAGTQDTKSTGQVTDLPDDLAKRVYFAVSLGEASDKHPRALSVQGTSVTGPARAEAQVLALVLKAGAARLLEKPQAADLEGADWAEFPALLLSGKKLDVAANLAAASRMALGFTEQRRVVVASSVHATPGELSDALLRAGCKDAVLLERGGSHVAEAFRSGTPSPPRVRYRHATLSFAAKPATPRTFKFDPLIPVEPKKKK